MTPPNLGGQNLVEDGASRSLYQTYRGTLNQLKIPRAPTHPNTLSQVLDKANGFLKAILQALPQVFPTLETLICLQNILALSRTFSTPC